ncbi:MAG: hypothetical protein ACYDGW_07995 [Vulcanimicrobiaceae bacterium]
MSWTIPIERARKPNLAVLADVRPMMTRLQDVFGLRTLGELLNIDGSNLNAYLHGRRSLPAHIAQRAIDLDHVLTRAAQLFSGEVVIDWLQGQMPTFAGARPIDVLATHGAGPLLDELQRIESGGCV